MCTDPAPARQGESGQIVILAMLALLPVVALLLCLLNSGGLVSHRATGQQAADGAAAAALQDATEVLNLAAVNNRTMVFLLAEAIAQEAFLRTLEQLVLRYEAEIRSLRRRCWESEGESSACDRAEEFERRRDVAADSRDRAIERLAPQSAFPGTRDQSDGGSLFTVMKQIQREAQPLLGTSLAAIDAGEAVARRHGARGLVLYGGASQIPIRLGVLSSMDQPLVREPAHGPSILELSAQEYEDRARRADSVFDMVEMFQAELAGVRGEWMARGDDELPRPLVLRDGSAGPQILSVVWRDAMNPLASRLFQVPPGARVTYAQARIVSRSGGDLFRQDWETRLVPAELLERADPPAELEATAATPPEVAGLFAVPLEARRWLNTH